jgi:hexosaminidase
MISTHLPHSQSYELEIEPHGIHVTAASPEAAFWAAQTLTQILRLHKRQPIPACQIEDRPDFRARGVMLDVSRDKVPTMATLFHLVDLFAELKLNHLQLYTEHTFAYRAHPTAWADASPLTGDEILQLDAYCRERFIELVPNQNSFGHMERWLKLPAYRDLADAPDGYTSPWGDRREVGSTLNPLDPRSIALVESLYDELLPHFTSPLFNVGCDETFDLGQGRSKGACDRHGKGRVYLDFLMKIHALVQDRGRMMMFWGDIILHHPDLIKELPRDVVALAWGYEADHPFDEQLSKFDDAGVPVFVCPGTSSWCSFAGRTDNALANLRNAARAGVAHDAAGYLITDWGDYGHHHPLSISYLPYAAGAAYAWSCAANEKVDLFAAIDGHLFQDAARVTSQLVADLGNVYQMCREPLANGSRLFWTLLGGPQFRSRFETVSAAEYAAAEARVGEIMSRLPSASIINPDLTTVNEELTFAGHILSHACRRGVFLKSDLSHTRATELARELQNIIETHRTLWLRRNRAGGLSDSVERLISAGKAYEK